MPFPSLIPALQALSLVAATPSVVPEPAAPPPPVLPTGDAAAFRVAMLGWNRDALPDAPPAQASMTMARPVDAGRLTSSFGVRSDPIDGSARAHRGIDIAGRYGSPVRAAADGVIVFAGNAGGYGQLVRIDHGEGVETRYGHLSALLARPGVMVRRGDVVGAMGSTGRSTGSHVHFEVRQGGVAVDPALPVGGDTLPAWGAVAPLPPVVPHWEGWRADAGRLPAAF